MRIAENLASWYHENKRDLPWRRTVSPYHIWISEIILQQTRVNQGLDYYIRFIEKYPTVIELARAPLDDVLKLWQGLGYYTRARNLHRTAQTIALEMEGVFPGNYRELMKLKGVGSYTAAAIASIAFNEPVALVDGNVSRVLARLYSIKIPVDSAAGKKLFERKAAEILDPVKPGDHNQAMMELGALVCLPKNPACRICPLAGFCRAFSEGKTAVLPVKKGKTGMRTRYYNYVFIQDHGFTYLHQRTGKDIWNALYEFPLIETDKPLDFNALKASGKWRAMFGEEEMAADPVSRMYKHQLTHQILYCTFYYIRNGFRTGFLPDAAFIRIPLNQLKRYAVPRIIEKYLDNLLRAGILSE